jgi:signal transduction histidine kinase
MTPPFRCGPQGNLDGQRGDPKCGFQRWPADERSRRQAVTRLRFFRRFALIAAFVMMCAVAGLISLAWAVARAAGFATASASALPLLLLGVLFAGGFLLIVTLGGTLRRIGSPLAAVMEAADRVAGGDYAVRVGEGGPPAIRALVRAFNTMTARLGDHDRQRRNLMADVAHELRTPLTVMQGTLEGMLDGVYPRDERGLAEALEQTRVLSRLVEDLRTLAMSESGALTLEKEPVDIAALARDIVRAFAADAASRGVTLEAAAADVPSIDADPLRIREVLSNLVSNAVRHTPAGGRVEIRVASGDGALTVEVRDTGTGMAEKELRRAFDRFHKGVGSHGSGLGLTIARSLAVAHGGDIRASSAPGQGTTMTVTLPATGAD